MLVGFQVLMGCELMVIPLIPLDAANNNAEGEKTALQPVRVVSAAGLVLAGPENSSLAEASLKVSRNTIVCVHDSKNEGFLAGGGTKLLSCNNGLQGDFHVAGGGFSYKRAVVRVHTGNQFPIHYCKGMLEGDIKRGSIAPAALTCADGSQGVLYAVPTSDTEHKYTVLINPTN